MGITYTAVTALCHAYSEVKKHRSVVCVAGWSIFPRDLKLGKPVEGIELISPIRYSLFAIAMFSNYEYVLLHKL